MYHKKKFRYIFYFNWQIKIIFYKKQNEQETQIQNIFFKLSSFVFDRIMEVALALNDMRGKWKKCIWQFYVFILFTVPFNFTYTYYILFT